MDFNSYAGNFLFSYAWLHYVANRFYSIWLGMRKSVVYVLITRDVPIIGSVTISADDMLFFTISVIGTACTGSRYKYQLLCMQK